MSGGGVPRVGVCSWSLRPGSAVELAERVRACGLRYVQLALDPIRRGDPGWGLAETGRALDAAGVAIVSGMMAPAGEDYSTLESIRATGGLRDAARWGEHERAAEGNAEIARELGLGLVTLHAGALPDDAAERAAMLARIDGVVGPFVARGVRIAFESGQEPVASVLELLGRYAASDVGVNFDPANMILYASAEPIGALRALASRVMQVHIKDALPTVNPGTWGRETPAGEGGVDWAAFFGVYRGAGLACDLVIEREGGDRRAGDVMAARELVEREFPLHEAAI